MRSSRLELGGFVEDEGAAGVAVLFLDEGELVGDDGTELGGGVEDGLVLGDVFADLGEFLEELVDGELGEAVELELEDGVDLAVGEDEGGAEAGVGRGRWEETGVDAVLGGIEGDAGELGAAEGDGAVAEK